MSLVCTQSAPACRFICGFKRFRLSAVPMRIYETFTRIGYPTFLWLGVSFLNTCQTAEAIDARKARARSYL